MPVLPRLAEIIRKWLRLTPICAGLAFFSALAWPTGLSAADVQFDVFLGYDETVHEGEWFPVVCELLNEGPLIRGTIVASLEGTGRNQSRQYRVELPTNTRKRVVLPLFAASGRYGAWTIRLLDESQNVRAERVSVKPRDKSAEAYLLGAVPRTFAGMPAFPDARTPQEERSARVCRLQLDYFTDNPITLEGLDAIYLNSEKAFELEAPQRAALLAWIYNGGHLILALEQAADLQSAPWLAAILPATVKTGVRSVRPETTMLRWLGESAERRNTPRSVREQAALSRVPVFERDPAFDRSEILAAEVTVADGTVVLEHEGTPLLVRGMRGRGAVTLLTFSPEREPFKSWKLRTWFWTRATGEPLARFLALEDVRYGGWNVDALIGAMTDSRQVRKLPVFWLLVMLVGYLLVIGPVDQQWLQRTNKQIWTWVTFPLYVAFFSGLIYFVGYKLRAGDTEWNELEMIDVLPRDAQAQLRGRTYGSIYSPANAKYRIASELPTATLRNEFQGAWAGGIELGRSTIEQLGNGYRAEVAVPVWTTQLLVGDWMMHGKAPVWARITQRGGKLEITLENRTDTVVPEVAVAAHEKIFDLGPVAALATRTVTVDLATNGMSLSRMLEARSSSFFDAVQQRRQAWGGQRSGQIEKEMHNLIAVSCISRLLDSRQNMRYFNAPRGFDVAPWLAQGGAVVFAWRPQHATGPPIHRFTPRREARTSFLRIPVLIEQGN